MERKRKQEQGLASGGGRGTVGTSGAIKHQRAGSLSSSPTRGGRNALASVNPSRDNGSRIPAPPSAQKAMPARRTVDGGATAAAGPVPTSVPAMCLDAEAISEAQELPRDMDPFRDVVEGRRALPGSNPPPAPQAPARPGQRIVPRARPPIERPEEVKKNLKEMKDVVVPMAVTSWKAQNAALSTMVASWKQLKEAVKNGGDELAAKEQKMASLLSELQQKEVEHAQERTKLQAELNQLRMDKEEMKLNIAQQEERLSQLTATLEAAKREKESLEGKIAGLDNSAQHLTAHLQSLQGMQSTLQAEKDTAMLNFQSMQTQYFALRTELSQSLTEKSSLQETILNLQMELSRVKEQASVAEGKIPLLEESINKASQQHDSLVADKNSQLEALKTQIEKLESEMAASREAQKNMELKLHEAEVAVQRLTMTTERLEAKNERLELDAREKQRQIDQKQVLLEQQVEAAAEKDKRLMQQGEDIVQLRTAIAQHSAVAQTEANSMTSESQAEIQELQKTVLSQQIELNRFKITIDQQENKLKDYETTMATLEAEKLELKKKNDDGILERRELQNTIQNLKGNVLVFCRVRPLLEGETGESSSGPVFDLEGCEKGKEIILCQETGQRLTFRYDKTFGPTAGQEEVFSEVTQLVQSSMDGFKVCIFSYGQTGTGKTHTMLGCMNPMQRGIIPRAIALLFEAKKELETLGWRYKIRASFLEIYMENIHDLLEGFPGAYMPPPGGPNVRPSDWVPTISTAEAGAASTSGAGAGAGAAAGGKKADPKAKGAAPASSGGRNLFGTGPAAGEEKKGKAKVKENAPREVHHDLEGNTWVDSMHEIELETVEQAMELVQYATKKRVVGKTDMNAQSSRSHCGFMIYIRAERTKTVDGKKTTEVMNGSLSLVDLAGNEKLKDSNAEGKTQQETRKINSGLLVLGKVFSSIQQRQRPPFRESKLTYLLQNCLWGNHGKALMFLNLSPEVNSLSQSKAALEFGTKVNNTEIGPARRAMGTLP